jgi:hypothetical protein
MPLLRGSFAELTALPDILENYYMTEPVNRSGGRQHERKRDKFSQCYDLMQEIQQLSERIVDSMEKSKALPLFDVAALQAKTQKLYSLIEVRSNG